MGLYSRIEKKTTGSELSQVMKGLYTYMEKEEFLDEETKHTIQHYSLTSDKANRRNAGWYMTRVAAAVLVIFSVVAALYFIVEPKVEVNQPIAEAFFKENPKGQKLTTFLPDGTKVILNSNSSVKYIDGGKIAQRQVQLQGEAFFEVVKDSLRPFTVTSNGVRTTALGTSFNVKIKDSGQVQVALLTGKVEVVGETDKKVVLLPGKSALVDTHGEMVISVFDEMEITGWKEGVLVFKDNSLAEIIKRLENWYGVTIISNLKPASNFRYSGINNNETLEEVLNGISFVHHFKYEIAGDTVKIY
ncbi:MAG: DUF4974 domain-containing protein [Cyclobacteriaceae bacterium]|nr:DUF4974 domain-containing protein [Cyclobacteriaceae bacterium]